MKMKTSLEHLPASKQEQILAIAALLQAEIPAEMIILFGSYARGDWVEDHDTRYFSDYDLLVVVAEAAQVKQLGSGNALWTRVRAIAGHVPVSPIVHDVKQLNKEIRAGQYFFVDILREGVRLHDSRRFQLASPKVLGKKERLEHARFNFRYWFNSASNFWRGAGYFMERKLDAHAAFLLHQTAERYFHAALLVFGGYKPRTHDLAALAKDTALLHPALAGALPRAEPEGERLFDLLRRAYIEARYSQSYHVTDEDLVRLRALTIDLGVRVREACVEMMGTFCGPEVVGVAHNSAVAQELADTLNPQLILMDIDLPGQNGLEATRLIKAAHPDMKIVMFTASEREAHLFEAIRNGASGYLLKGAPAEVFFSQLSALARGEVPLSPGLASRVLAEFARLGPTSTQVGAGQPESELTDRQWDILKRVARGQTYKEIGAELHLSEPAIRYHMGQIIERLHVANRTQAVAYLRRIHPLSP